MKNLEKSPDYVNDFDVEGFKNGALGRAARQHLETPQTAVIATASEEDKDATYLPAENPHIQPHEAAKGTIIVETTEKISESPTQEIERLANQLDAQAQEKLLAANMSLGARVMSIAKRGWEATKNAFQLIGDSIISPIIDTRKNAKVQKEEEERLRREGDAFLEGENRRIEAQNAFLAEQEKEETRLRRIRKGIIAATLLLEVEGEKTEGAQISEKLAFTLGTIIEAAQSGVQFGKDIPEKISTGARNTQEAVSDLLMVEDFKEVGTGLKNMIVGSVSGIGALLLNQPVQEKLIQALYADNYLLGEENDVFITSDEDGNGTVQREGARDLLVRMLKSKLLNKTEPIRDAIRTTADAVANSSTTKKVKTAAGYVALGSLAIATAPVVISATAVAGAYELGKRGYTKGAEVAKAIPEKAGSATGAILAPMVDLAIKIENLPKNIKREEREAAQKLHNTLMETAENINAKTRETVSVYRKWRNRLNLAVNMAQQTFNRIKQEIMDEETRNQDPKTAQNVRDAITTLEKVNKETA